MWCALIAACAFALYLQTAGFSFVEYDDPAYVTQNPHVAEGLTWKSVAWALTSVYGSNWHPLTWLSHMLDIELFGMNAGMHHLVNVFFHAANGVLLFLALEAMTGYRARSAVVALLFTVHPLHVESVAWVAERKDVLSTTFWMLAMAAYASYARNPSKARYALVALAFALGLTAKPMLVTLPFVLLLLDFWPLGRVSDAVLGRAPGVSGGGAAGRAPLTRLDVEKIPLVILSALSSAVTFYAQAKGGSVRTLDEIPICARVANSVVSYAMYLAKTFVPMNLAAFYPFPPRIEPAAVIVSGAALALVSALAALWWKKRPYLATGWLWYLGTLVPVIGLVQVGKQSMADRYTYVPLVGVFVMLTWGLADLAGGGARAKKAKTAAAVAVVGLCMVLTYRQVGYWENGETLFRRMISSTKNNSIGHYNLGCVLQAGKDYDEAMTHYEEALRIDPKFLRPRYNLAGILLSQGRYDEAIGHYKTSLEILPGQAKVLNNLGTAYFKKGDLARAIRSFEEACSSDPRYKEARKNLDEALRARETLVLRLEGELERARRNTRDVQARLEAADTCRSLGRYDEAEELYRECLALDGSSERALKGLAVLARDRSRWDEALSWLERLAAARPSDPLPLYDIACIHALAGRREEAVESLRASVRKGFSDFSLLARDPDLASIRDHPYVASLLGSGQK